MQTAMHAARLAHLEGALCALFREAAATDEPNDSPDGLIIRASGGISHLEIEIEYTRGGIPVAGESL